MGIPLFPGRASHADNRDGNADDWQMHILRGCW
jgi:hypothetical protein